MKNKILVLFALLTVVMLCFAACDTLPSVNDLQSINDMLKQDYSQVMVLTSTKTAQAELTGKFTMHFEQDQTTIEYEYDRVNTFDIEGDGDGIATPDGDYIVREKGVAVVRDGEVVDEDDSLNLEEFGLKISGFSFKQAFFDKANFQSAKFEADVVNAQDFTGNKSLNCTDMHVAVFFNTNTKVITRMDITYTSANGAAVAINYVFTK